jgi:hypothetical protein
MAKEYEWQDHADLVIGSLHVDIHLKDQFVKREHDLVSKLASLVYVIDHITERIPKEMKNLHNLNSEIEDKIMDIKALVESDRLKDLKIEEEETEDINNKNWRAVKKEGKGFIKLKHGELKELHSKFIDLMKLMKRKKLVKAIEYDAAGEKEKEKYEKLEEYYFLQIYRLMRAYEKIFRELWKKERGLTK